jgi:hypothetical protein
MTTISQVILTLQELLKKHGDIPVTVNVKECFGGDYDNHPSKDFDIEESYEVIDKTKPITKDNIGIKGINFYGY